MKPIIFIGGGGHLLSLLDVIPDNTKVTGYADIRRNENLSIEFLGKDCDVLKNYKNTDVDVHISFVYAEKVCLEKRKQIIDLYKDYQKASIIADTAIISSKTSIGEGCAIMDGSIVKAIEIGKNTIINTGAIVEHGCRVGDNVLVASGAIICGDVEIGDDCIIGAGAVLRDGIKVCSGSVIGLGAIVTKDIIKSGVYVGNPAKRIK